MCGEGKMALPNIFSYRLHFSEIPCKGTKRRKHADEAAIWLTDKRQRHHGWVQNAKSQKGMRTLSLPRLVTPSLLLHTVHPLPSEPRNSRDYGRCYANIDLIPQTPARLVDSFNFPLFIRCHNWQTGVTIKSM